MGQLSKTTRKINNYMKIKLFKILKGLTKIWYWLLVIILWCVQVVYTLHSTNKIRLEELAESVRNVFWLQNRAIYDGISSNVGWYGTLLVIYNLFGFFLFEAKYYRLVIHLISLLCIAKLLKKYLGEKKAWLPLLVIGLSPTLLYFNTLQTSFGIDLQYFPICLYLLLTINFSNQLTATIKQFLLWSLAMISSMSYPSFVPYIPILMIIYMTLLVKVSKNLGIIKVYMNILISLVSFCLPFIFVLNFLREPQLLIFDSHVKSGIFRGGGKITYSLSIIRNNIIDGTWQVMKDLFINPNSYYFEADIVRAEFAHHWLWGAVGFILLISFFLFIKVKKARLPLILSWLLIIGSLIMGNISGAPFGLRRCTGFLASFYAIYICVWKYGIRRYYLGNFWLTILIILSLLLIPLHHLKVYPNNFVALYLLNPHATDSCYNKISNRPDMSLNYYLNQVKNFAKINQIAETKDSFNINPNWECRLHYLYSGIAGSCLWNHLNCPPILGYDENTKGFIRLSTTLWENYYFNH